MWRRVLAILLASVGLSGLPALAACAADASVTVVSCCPEHDGCGSDAPGPDRIECCALDQAAGPTVAATLDPAKRILLDANDDSGGPHAFVPVVLRNAHARADRATAQPFIPSQSDLWRITARLRL
jgi:hypothetical protein